MTADSSSNNHSPRSPAARRSLHSPWAQVVRGEPDAAVIPPSPPSSSAYPPPPPPPLFSASASDCSAAEAPAESSNSGGNGNAGPSKKPAWNKLSNAVIETEPVMGAVSWPSLSECTRPSPKVLYPPAPISNDNASTPQEPVTSHPPNKQANANANSNANRKFNQNHHKQPNRQKSMKRGGTGSGPSQSAFSGPVGLQAPPPPPPPPPLPLPFPVFEMPYKNIGPPFKGSNWENRPMGSAGGAVNDHSLQRSSPRRGNFGLRPRGDGVHNNGYGGRRGNDKDWNGPRGPSARDAQMTHQMVPPSLRGFMGPLPSGSTPFLPNQSGRPFVNHLGFDMSSQFIYVPALPPEPFRGMPLVAHGPPPPPPMFVSLPGPTLPTLVVDQIDYYFSDTNLKDDNYLRSNMDDQGWVPIELIASFRRGDKVRKRNDWWKWIPASGRFPTDSGMLSPSGTTDCMLAASLQKVALDEVTSTAKADDHTEVVPVRFTFEELSSQSKHANGEGTAEACSGHC
ncbi:hypothetical protein RJ639_005862 [Escallonia herrerae]|uniref:HTH La-type RNA-binding domain-containing protein n=1 Tax=Escallonia herrerae TaxID=1293975 RepID=A0AA89ATT3_9ASTE|nr:hypothetical protein RJ639_005862 [Escallonia herrerae]